MNKRLTKLLSVFVIAGAISAGAAFAATGCNNKPDDPGKQEQTTEYTVTEVKVTASKTTAKVGEKVTLSVEVKGENNPSQEVTWAITEGSDKATLSGTELTLTGEGTVKVQATSKADTTKKGEVTITVSAAEAKPTVSGVTVTAEGTTTVCVGDKVNLSAEVAGENDPAQTVTWSIKDGATATGCTVADGVLTTGTVAGSVTVVATSTVDTTKSGELAITVEALTVESNPSVPTYSGPNAGPSNQAGQTTSTLCPTTSLTATPAEDFVEGVFTVKANSEVRARSRTGVYTVDKAEIDATAKFTHSIKNGTVEIKAPKAGKLAIYAENGSSSSLAEFKITGLEGVPVITEKTAFKYTNKEFKNVVKFEFDVTQAGTYLFEKASGTVDVYKMEYIYELEPSAYTEISVTNKGTTDYLLTQQLDCTGVKVSATDKNGVLHEIPAENCEFDTSKFNPNAAGEYEIGVSVKLTNNLDGTTEPLKTSYTVKVYAVEELNIYTLSYASNKQSTLKQAYVTGEDFSADNLTVMAKCKLGADTIDYKLKNEWFSVIAPDLNTSGKKQVKINVSRKYTAGNKNVNTTYDIVVKDKIDAQNGKVELTVGENGDFETLTQAVQYLKACKLAKEVHKVIKLQAGTYSEKVWIDVDNVTLVGQGATKDDTVITYSAVEDTVDLATGSRFGLSCATVHVTGKGFKAYNISIRNDFDYINENTKYGSPQGLALTIAGDGAVLNNVHLFGNQDTLYLKARAYFYKSQIDGNIDFIFGEPTGLAYFDECEIKAIVRSAIDPETGKGTNQNGYVTAMKADANTKPDYGYIFNNCEFTDDGKVADGSMSLGRPWGAKATVAYINCSFTKAYATSGYNSGNKTDRWSAMSSNAPSGADFCEYGSTGEGAISTAVDGGKILTETEAANYTKANIFGTANGKSGYTTEFDCDTALKILNILAGVEQGELPKETKIVIDFKDENLPNGACVEQVNAMYADKITWTGAGSFEVKKPENGIKIGTDTVITVNVVGEVSLVAGYELPTSDYTITYKDGKATIKFVVATGTYGTYLGGIVIDTTKTPADTPAA